MRAPSHNGPVHRLQLFGGPVLTDPAGHSVSVSPGQEALMALVWGHGDRGVARGRAIWLLWEEEDTPRSRHRLRQLLHEVRTRIGATTFADADDVLRADRRIVPCDLDRFDAALNRDDLRAALGLFAQRFASKLRRVPGREFEDWLEAKRAGLRRTLLDAAAAKWDRSHEAGDWVAARDAAEVLHALESTEASLRKLIQARASTGNPGLAEAAYAEFRGSPARGDPPSVETEELMTRIRSMVATGSGPEGARPDQPPLIGRNAELQRALKRLDRIEGDAFEFILIQGEAGVGKTRLLDELMREAHLKGFRCLEARPAEPERRIPMNPLVDMVTRRDLTAHVVDLEEPWRAVVASFLPTLPRGMDPPVVPHIAETSLARRLYDAFTLLLTSIATEHPTLLFIDDLQWADETTLAVLQFAQRRWQQGALGIVATVRTDPMVAKGAVDAYLGDSRDLPVTRIKLEDLDGNDAIRLVDTVAEGSLDADTQSRLCALGGRSPFYLIELTRDYLAGRVQLPEVPSDTLLIPISLRQLVDPRLADLSQPAAEVAAHLAVLGRWVSLSTLAGLMKGTMPECTHWVEELERSRLVTVERGQVSIAHQLFRSAIYHRMTKVRQALLHRMIADYLTTIGSPQAGELAVHYAHAGESAPAALHGRTAADAALEKGAVAESAFFLQLVLDNETDERLKAEATGDLARVLHMNREILRANPLLELAATRLRAVGNRARALRMDVRRVEGLAEVGAAPMSELLDRLAAIKATARSENDDDALTFALDHELHLLHRSGRIADVRNLLGEIRLCRDSPNPVARCQANASLALNVLFGDGDEGLQCARDAVRIADEEGLEQYALLAGNRLYLALLYRGLTKTSEAQSVLAKTSESAKKSGDVILRFTVTSNRGVAHFDAAELAEAHEAFMEAGKIITRAEASVMQANHHCNLAELAYEARDVPEALSEFLEAKAILGDAAAPVDVAQIVNAGIGLCYLDLGAVGEARAREAFVRPLPERWSFDATLVLAFTTRMMEKRSEREEALHYIRTHRERLRWRLPPAWIRSLPFEARLLKRLGRREWVDVIRDGIAVAEDLRFTERAAQLRGWL